MSETHKEEKILANHNWNEERTSAFVTSKPQRRNDSISWMVSGLIILFLTIVSLGRITVVGQFLDDVIFNFLFGWFKYVVYLLFFFVDICIFTGIRFKFKKRFLCMIFTNFLILCWLITLIVYSIKLSKNAEGFTGLWQKDIFAITFNTYSQDWFNASIFGKGYFTKVLDYFIKTDPIGYFNLNSGGGVFGAVLTGISSYLSVIGAYFLWAFFAFVNLLWIFTGDPLYLFKPKVKRKGKSLRILSLKAKKNPNLKERSKQVNKIENETNSEDSLKNPWESINVFGKEDIDLGEDIKTSDLTIQMPSYFKNEERIFLDNLQKDKEIEKLSKPTDDINLEEVEEIIQPQYKFVSRRQKTENEVLNANLSKQFIKPQSPQTNVLERELFITQTQQEDQSLKFDRSIEQETVALTKTLNDEKIMVQEQNKEEKRITLEETKNDKSLIGDDTFFNSIYEEPTIVAKNVTINYEEKEIDIEADLNQWQTNLVKDNDTPNSIDQVVEKEDNVINETLPYNHVLENSNHPKLDIKKAYKLPPIDVLVKMEKDYNKDRANKENAALKALAIDETFNQFGVKAKVVNSIIGPSVMKFEIQTAPGTKVNSITNLENDLKLALATNNMRLETPIPGKTLIGIEIANSFSEMVSMREIIESIPETAKDEKLLFVLGKNVLGQPLTAQLNKMPHLLVAGSTGSGKSVMINTLICSILLRAKPSEVKFIMIDPKKVELSIYSRIPHMLAPVISDMKQAANALKMVVMEMERRYEQFMSIGARNIDGYNKKVSLSNKKMPYHVIIIDELADLMMTGDRKAVEESITRITQMARAAGIHLIVATQRPSVDVITGTIKTNIPTRIAFAVTTGIDSRTILDSIGAENLLGRGDMLFMPPGGGDLMRAQGAYMSDEEIEEIVAFTIAQQQAQYNEDFDGEKLANINTKDELFGSAKEFALSRETLTTSELKGKFGIGDSRAVNIMSQLEEENVIGPKNGTKPREVLK